MADIPRIRLVGDPVLTRVADPVRRPDPALEREIAALHAALDDFRRRAGFGRAIAAPQIGISKRIIAVNLGATPFTVINPTVTWMSSARFALWDDCLSAPDRVVRVERARSISLDFEDAKGRRRRWERLPEDLSELMQHEIDHLDGVLMMARAVPGESVRPIAERDALVGPSRPTRRLSLDRIAEAARAIDPVFRNTPAYADGALCEALGVDLTLKVETLNPIRSFKGRGADFFLGAVEARGDARPLLCASAGNFGQAMAYAARRRGRAMTVYAAETANARKIARMRALGAEVRIAGGDFDAAKAAARAEASASGAWFVEDGREPEISEGAGSIAVELLAGDAAFDAVAIPLGNGALLTGMARWIKAASPMTRVFGVSAEAADAMEKSWRSGAIVNRDAAPTAADGIGVREPIPEAVDDMRGVVDDVLLVSEAAIGGAMRDLFEHAGLVAEPAGGVGVAALREHARLFQGLKVATVICGSNLAEEAQGWLAGA